MTLPFTRKHRRLSQKTINGGFRRDIQSMQLKLQALEILELKVKELAARLEDMEESETRANRIREEAQRHKLRRINPGIAV